MLAESSFMFPFQVLRALQCPASYKLSGADLCQLFGAGRALKPTEERQPYLYLVHLLIIVDVHLLEGVLQLLVALQERLAELGCQVQVWTGGGERRTGVNNREWCGWRRA